MHLLRTLTFLTLVVLGGCARPLPKYEKPMARAQFQKVRTTAYTHTEDDHLVHGRKTCMGTHLRSGPIKSAAADWSRWPAGTMFRIQDTGEVYEVDDIGWALSGRNTIDLYKTSKSAMNAWGVRTVDIEILKWGEDRDSWDILKNRRKHRHVARMLTDLDKRISRGEENPVLVQAPVVTPPVVAVATPAVVPAASSAAPALRSFRGSTVQ